MATSNDNGESYLHLFTGYMNTALDNISDIYSPASLQLGIQDELVKISDTIQVLLGNEEYRQLRLAQLKASTAAGSTNTAAATLTNAAAGLAYTAQASVLPNTAAAGLTNAAQASVLPCTAAAGLTNAAQATVLPNTAAPTLTNAAAGLTYTAQASVLPNTAAATLTNAAAGLKYTAQASVLPNTAAAGFTNAAQATVLPNTAAAGFTNAAQATVLPNTAAAGLTNAAAATLPNTSSAVLPNEESIECCLSKLQDVSLTSEELMDVALILVDKADMSDIVERDDNTYECLVCKTNLSDMIRLMKHIHNAHHKLKQKVSRKMCQTNVKVPVQQSNQVWYVVSKMNPLSPHCVTYLGPEVYHCTICNEVLRGNTEVVIDHNMEESHRSKYLELHKKPALRVDNPSLGLPTQAPSNTTARERASTSTQGVDISAQKASNSPAHAPYKTTACDRVKKRSSQSLPFVPKKVKSCDQERPCQSTSRTPPDAPVRDKPNPLSNSTMLKLIKLLYVLRDREQSFARRCDVMWQFLDEIEGADVTCNTETEELWCSVCRITFYSPFNAVQHIKGKNHTFLRLVEDKKWSLLDRDYSGCKAKEEELMWEILADIEEDGNICDNGNYRYYCSVCYVDISGPRKVIKHISRDDHRSGARGRY